jgi:hypothetical protein
MGSLSPCVFLLVVVSVALAAACTSGASQDAGEIRSRWADDVDPDSPLPEYPRPTMVRSDWLNLNGRWELGVTARAAEKPAGFDRTVIVPFPVESALSGLSITVTEQDRLWYRRTFRVPEAWDDRRVLLHFGASDWKTEVRVNGAPLPEHAGGYDAFSYDITDHLRPDGDQELVVSVWDPTDKGPQPTGKQVLEPHGIWYTAVSGIWQTVWLEPVPDIAIRSLRITPDLDASRVTIGAAITGAEMGDMLVAEALAAGQVIARGQAPVGEPVALSIEDARVWSPDDPHLYTLRVRIMSEGRLADEVTSYFGMRKIALGPGEHGPVLYLNNEPLFQIGPLDQGWWPDGLYTAPTDQALRYDVEIMKQLGFNMVRKHVKVEPERWYHHCDRIGLLVWQDMPSGSPAFLRPREGEREVRMEADAAGQFRTELAAMIEQRYNHPSVVMWVPFNEGWGQFETNAIADFTRKLDPTRPINAASGWHDLGGGDVLDIHSYPGPSAPDPEDDRAIVLGEFGGFGLPLRGHLWNEAGRNWGYRNLQDSGDLLHAYELLFLRLHMLIPDGLCAAVYTQLTDVEGEVNGLLTYDRAVLKIDAAEASRIHTSLHGPAPTLETIVPTSMHEAQVWQITTAAPADDWFEAGFDDSAWETAKGGFGTKGTPGAVIGHTWDGSEIWVRRSFVLDEIPANPFLMIHHDEDAKVYLNGELVAELGGYTQSYGLDPAGGKLRQSLRRGENKIAIHCRQTSGGQFLDCGIVGVTHAAD